MFRVSLGRFVGRVPRARGPKMAASADGSCVDIMDEVAAVIQGKRSEEEANNIFARAETAADSYGGWDVLLRAAAARDRPQAEKSRRGRSKAGKGRGKAGSLPT